MNRLVEDAVANRLGAVSGDLQLEIAKGTEKGLAGLNAKTEDLKKQMDYFAKSAADTEKRLNAAGSSVLLKIGYLSAFALVCVIGAALWLGFYYSKQISEKKASVENLEMLLQADIVKCGGQLCAKVGRNTPAQFRKSGYMLIERK